MELARATSRPSPSVTPASTKATRRPPETTSAVHVSTPPGRTAARKLTFISALAENTFRPLAQVTVAAPMAESQNAAMNPPWRTPAGFVNLSSAAISQTVRPGSDFSTQTIPRVRSQLGGTCIGWSAIGSERYPTPPRPGALPSPALPGYRRGMASPATTLLRAATVLTPDGPLSPGEVTVEDGVIVAVGPPRPGTAPDLDPDRVLVPGFLDLQVNGIGTVDVATADGDDWDRLDEALLAQGVTTWCPTLTSTSDPALAAALDRVTAAARRTADRPRPTLAGAHLEGPFLAVAGAHPPEHLRPVLDPAWPAGLPAVVRLVTLAPELPGALDAVRFLTDRGILVALGHSACTYEEARVAAAAGARLVTHLGNAMAPFHHRRPGLLGAALTDPLLTCSLIADLVHVHPALLHLAFAAKGPAGCLLVTDAVAAAAGRVGPVTLDPATTVVGPGGLPPRLADGTLAGSVLTVDRALTNLVGAGITLADAVTAVTATPARLLGLHDRGAIAPGRRADLVELETTPTGLVVRQVWVAGRPAGWSR